MTDKQAPASAMPPRDVLDAQEVYAAERRYREELESAFGPQTLEAWTCMRCGYPHKITTRDRARGVIDQDRCHCGENFYERK